MGAGLPGESSRLTLSAENIARNLYGTYSLAEILNTMSNAAKRVSARARDIIDEVHVRTYETTKTIQQQLDDIARNQVKMQLFMEATSRSEHLLRFVMSQINAGSFPGRGLMYAEPPEPSERSTHRGSATLAPTYTPSELLERLDVNHQQVEADANYMFQKGYATLRPERIERAAGMMTAPEVHRLLGGSTSGMVAVDGYSDGRQMTVITPTGYMVAMLRHCLIEQGWDHRRSRPRYWNWNEQPGSPISPTYEEANDQCIVLAHFCGFHTDEHDPLSGLRGLVRSLAAQLVWGFLYNGWYGHEAPLVLPMSLPPQQEPENNGGDDMSYHSDEDGNRTERDDRASRRYSDGMEGRESDNEEARPSRCTLMLDELCELLQALLQLVPQGASVTCLIDSWSSFECDGMARDYEIVLDTLCSAVAYASDRHNAVGAIKLLLISPVASTWLTDYYRPHADYEDEDGDSGGGGEKDDCYRDGSNSPASSMRVRFPRCFSRVSLRGAIRGGRLGQPPAMTSGFLNGSPAGQDEKAWDVDDDSEADVD